MRLADRGGPAEGLEPEICRRVGDASIIKIHAPQGRPVTLTAWKGITSVYEVFYAHRPNDDFIVSDHFRDILAQLPIEERTPADSSVIDHFLFKVVPGTNSYSRNVQRLGSGERLLIDIASGRVETALFHRLEPSGNQGHIADFIDHLDNKFTSVLQPFKGENAIANFFTGGVDSTLVQSYLGNDVTALNLVPQWLISRWDFQSDYAPRAARLLGVELERQAVMGGRQRHTFCDIFEPLS